MPDPAKPGFAKQARSGAGRRGGLPVLSAASTAGRPSWLMANPENRIYKDTPTSALSGGYEWRLRLRGNLLPKKILPTASTAGRPSFFRRVAKAGGGC